MGLEKQVPHYSLTKLKRLIEEGKYKFTFSSKKTLVEILVLQPRKPLRQY